MRFEIKDYKEGGEKKQARATLLYLANPSMLQLIQKDALLQDASSDTVSYFLMAFYTLSIPIPVLVAILILYTHTYQLQLYSTPTPTTKPTATITLPVPTATLPAAPVFPVALGFLSAVTVAKCSPTVPVPVAFAILLGAGALSAASVSSLPLASLQEGSEPQRGVEVPQQWGVSQPVRM